MLTLSCVHCSHGQDDPLFLVNVVDGDNYEIYCLTIVESKIIRFKAIFNVRTCEIALNIFMTRREGVE